MSASRRADGGPDNGFDIRMPFVEHLGLEMLEFANGRAVIKLDPRPEHMNSWKAVHGGMIMSLLDVALSSAARSLDAECSGCTTIEMKVNFIAAARGVVLAEGTAMRAGRSLLYCEGVVRDAAGTLLSKANGTFKLLYPKPEAN